MLCLHHHQMLSAIASGSESASCPVLANCAPPRHCLHRFERVPGDERIFRACVDVLAHDFHGLRRCLVGIRGRFDALGPPQELPRHDRRTGNRRRHRPRRRGHARIITYARIGNNVCLQHFPIGVVLYSGIPETAQTMLKTKASKKKLLKIISPQAVKPPETASDTPPTPFDPPPVEAKQETPPPFKRKPGRPEKKSFWDHVNEIPLSEWQAKRFYLYAYLSEPFCNIKTEGEPGYLRKFYEPVDPEFFLKEWGSGKYFLRLKEKRPGEKSDRDVDTLTFEIYNPTYPPKLPRKLWENDPRNERWLSMLPKEQKEASKQETMEILNAMFDMQDRIEDRIERAKGGEEPQTPNSILDTAARLIELTKPKENTSPTVDPFDTVQKILNMRSVDPMMTLMMTRMEAQDKAAEAARNREAELQKELRELTIRMLTPCKQNGNGSKSLIEQIKELAGAKTEIMNLLGIGGTDGAAAPRSRMSGTMEFWKDLVTELVNAPVINIVRCCYPASCRERPALPRLERIPRRMALPSLPP